MAEESYHVIVIGGGAAGMAAAVAALEEAGKFKRAERDIGKNRQKMDGSETDSEVLLLESNDRVGKKILATGNGKCNFTHADISAEHYHTDDQAVLNSILRDFPTEAALRFFERLGMLSKEKNGYYYPISETASTVLDVLRLRLAELDCKTLCGIHVESVETSGEGFLVRFAEKERQFRVFADRVILATGSKAGGFLQNKTEDPLRIPNALGLHSTPLYPALTKCICREEHYYRQLAGVRAQAKISVYAEKNPSGGKENFYRLSAEKNGKNIEYKKISVKDRWASFGQESGELQLTKEGISGIAVFQLSGDIAEMLAAKKRVIVEINFLPGFAEERLEEWVKNRLALLPGRTLEEFFLGVLHKKVLQVCLQMEGLRGNMQIPQEDAVQNMQHTEREARSSSREKNHLSAEKRAFIMISSVMKRAMHFTTEVTAVSDIKQAQVCRGGLLLSQFDEKLECKAIPGLFACGEMLNVDGECGGYNLHFAWASGNLAGREAMRRACVLDE